MWQDRPESINNIELGFGHLNAYKPKVDDREIFLDL
jgi:hypothetical protein